MYDQLVLISKIASLFIFVPIFIGATVWAYRRDNREKLEAYAALPLEED
jgi:cbb3-type cytochrome oxidase subunit 3